MNINKLKKEITKLKKDRSFLTSIKEEIENDIEQLGERNKLLENIENDLSIKKKQYNREINILTDENYKLNNELCIFKNKWISYDNYLNLKIHSKNTSYSGIYCLGLKGTKKVYIGKADRVLDRISQHIKDGSKGKDNRGSQDWYTEFNKQRSRGKIKIYLIGKKFHGLYPMERHFIGKYKTEKGYYMYNRTEGNKR